MGELKRIMISLPDSLLAEVDGMVALEKTNRSELIRQAMLSYIDNRKRRELRDQLRRGYAEMAALNLTLAEESLLTDYPLQQPETRDTK